MVWVGKDSGGGVGGGLFSVLDWFKRTAIKWARNQMR